MLFHIQCVDRTDAGTTRPDTRPAHLVFLEKFVPQIITSGPLLSAEGKPFGSVFVIDFPNEAAARQFCADDPYAKAGLFASTTITRFRQVYPSARE
ncbi:YciI family protein [Roseiterribacter gracilis]|uniref:YCII-related domain-containing protein n=1 Tax=Roseiterribacter gracilis TaxID=2812848 RepID=A0A8S8XHQ1_9PROT|nr:hypothetical protein TMPK1_30230 [Rhodospirillales bacterium TMPK1]